MSPALRVQNQLSDAELAGDAQSRAKRMLRAVNDKLFVCPANDLKIGVFGSSGSACNTYMPQSFTMPSYNTAAVFFWYPPNSVMTDGTTPAQNSGQNLITVGSLVSSGSGTLQPPAGYSPRIRSVGATSNKVYMADAARYTDGTQLPDLNLQPKWSSDYATHFQTFGPLFQRDYGMNRACAPGNTATAYDARPWWARHGSGGKTGTIGDFRTNLLFFDAHVETQKDYDACNPAYWMPAASLLNTGGGSAATFKIQPESLNRWFGGATGIYVAP
jgi:prepilin-type processing-associated H-X9-DG protein